MSLLFDSLGDAIFSDCRKYRYLLWRQWDENKPCIGFVGLNPSKANEIEPDNTITRVIGFAKSWGFGGVYMMNLFPYVSTDPDKLIECEKHHLDRNDFIVGQYAHKFAKVIFAWGSFKQVAEDRIKFYIDQFPNGEALIINKNGSPRHPLYVKGDVVPVPFKQLN